MKKFVCLLLLLTLGLSCCAFAEETALVGTSREAIAAQWGNRINGWGNSVGIWKQDGQTLVATFVLDRETQQQLVQDYVILDDARQMLAGTIPAEDTLFHVYDVVSSTPAAEIPGVVDVGSGVVIHAKITADGYVVCWQGDNPNIFTDLFLDVYDGVKDKADGRKMEYLAYVMTKEDADAQDTSAPYTLDELLTYFAPDAAGMAEVSAHEAVQHVDLQQLPDEKRNIAALCECFPNTGTSAEGTHTYQEVLMLDANVQGNALGRGVATEHCASDGTYWQIWYRPDKEGWPVESVTQMQRDELMTILRYISPEDMPDA